MNLLGMECHRVATVVSLGRAEAPTRLESVGIRVGAAIEVLSKTASRGYLVKVDDTRVVVGIELAKLINCSYSSHRVKQK